MKKIDSEIDTKIVKIDPLNIDYNIIKEAAIIIRSGRTVVFPTETVYGIGADAFNDEAVNKIFEAKGRPQDNPLIVHISDIEQLSDFVSDIPHNAVILAENFWPGPMTMIFNKKSIMSDKITAGLDTVAIRLPSNEIARLLIRESRRPIAAPSANISGKPSPTEVSHVIDDLIGKVDMIIDGGNTEIGLESTVVDVTVDVPMILRPGKVTQEDIMQVIEDCQYDPAIIKSTEKIVPKSPGQKYRHYSPKAVVVLYKGSVENMVKKINEDLKELEEQGKKVGIMSTTQTENFYDANKNICMGDRTNLMTVSSNLFRDLRNFDKIGVDVILAESVDEKGIGKAVMNRLSKASSRTVTV